MLPDTERLLLGPGPSPISPRVATAMTAAPRSHLDPDLTSILDDIRARLTRVLRAPDGSLVLAVSGTGTAAMETAIANLVADGTRVLAIENGYFGQRLAEMARRYGGMVERLESPWGEAVPAESVGERLARQRFDLVTVVHAETSTGVRNPVREIAEMAHEHDALVLADAVTSLGAIPFDMQAWGIDACYSCSQKGLGAPPGLSPIALSPRALDRRVASRSFYLDLQLLSDYWVARKYHHTISSPLVYALWAALGEIEDEGLDARWARHDSVHRALVDGLARIGLDLLPPIADRLWNLNAVRVPDKANEAAVRARLLTAHSIEIGAGLGPLSGRIWRVGLMGAGATRTNVDRLLAALAEALPPAS
jgi:alanine-glyoxylate transaminase/serine-glyoxylate transaminase/serine-pyruvate transaminase